MYITVCQSVNPKIPDTLTQARIEPELQTLEAKQNWPLQECSRTNLSSASQCTCLNRALIFHRSLGPKDVVLVLVITRNIAVLTHSPLHGHIDNLLLFKFEQIQKKSMFPH